MNLYFNIVFRYKILYFIIFIFSSFKLNSQCTVSINASSTTVPCGGGTVTLTASGSGNTTAVLDNNFDTGNAGLGWNVSPAGQFNNPCDPSIDGGTYMWMGNTTAAPRTLETAPLDVSCGGDICFYLDFATQGGTGSCEGPDLTNEGVYLEYSINGGVSWNTINYFQPNAGGTSGPYLTWAQYCFPIPAAAQTTSTIFHWFQDGSSGTCCDHWGIDNVTITAQNCTSAYYDWDNIAGTTGPVGDPANQTVTVTTDTSFTVCFTDGAGFNCCETINITVLGMSPPTISTVDELCMGDNNGQISVTPIGGTPNYTIDITGSVNQTLSGAGNQNFNNLPPGNYNVTLTDNAGCVINETATLNQGANCCPMSLSITGTDNSCHVNNGPCDGTATVTQLGGLGVITYQWYDLATNTQLAGQTTNIATGLCAGTYYVEVIDQTPCTLYDTIIIDQPTELTMVFSTFDPSCFGGSDGQAIVIPSGGTQAFGYTYNWLPAGTGTSNSPNAQNLSSGAYSLTVIDDNSCQVDTNFVINDPAEVVIDAINVIGEVCLGDCSGEIHVTASLANNFILVGPNGTFNNASGSFTSLCSGAYTVTVENANLCSDSQIVNVSSPNLITLNVSPDTTVCIGGSALLFVNSTGGTGSIDYFWDSGLPNGVSNFVIPISDTVINVHAIDDNGCSSDTLPINVFLYPPLTINAFSDTAICFGDSVSINAIGFGGVGSGYVYNWDQGIGTGAFQYVSPLSNTSYTVTLTDVCESPSVSGIVNVSINPLPQPDFTANPIEGCVPLTVDFTEIVSNPGSSCIWDFGDGSSNTDCGNVDYTYDTVGCFDVSLSMISDQGCFNSITYTDLVCVHEYPIANFSVADNPISILDPVAIFSNSSSSNSTSFLWEFGENGFLGQSADIDPVFTFPNDAPGFYEVCLSALNSFGCLDQYCMDIQVQEEFIIYVPNSFSPDGNGINEEFFPYIFGHQPQSYKIYIFNRWGEMIFESFDVNKKWNGHDYRNNKLCKSDIYIWKIKANELLTGELREFQGHVMLIR